MKNDLVVKVINTEMLPDGNLRLLLRAPHGTIITPAMRRVIRPGRKHWVKRVIRGKKPGDVTVVVSATMGYFKLATNGRRHATAVSVITHRAAQGG